MNKWQKLHEQYAQNAFQGDGHTYTQEAKIAELERLIGQQTVEMTYNAKAESFMKTLKYEPVYLSEYENLADARAQIGHFLEAVYNQKRLHSSLGYLLPTEYEKQFEKAYNESRDKHQAITP